MGYAHGKQWNEESIKNSILQVVEDLELNRMPSRAEVEGYYKDTSLANAVSRKYTWYGLAKELGLPIKESETYFGKKQEEIAREQLVSQGYEVRRMPQNFPYDLLIDDCVKIDVKASRLYKGTAGNFYSFNLEKPYSTCDIYLLYILNDDKTTKDVLIVPSKIVPCNTQISVGENKSKYYRFSQKWGYIEQYVEFLGGIA